MIHSICFRHCIVATGITCTTCDAGKEESVPLIKDDEETATPDYGSSDSVALETGESSTSTTDSGFYQTGYLTSGGYQTGYNQGGYQGGSYFGGGGYQPNYQSGYQQQGQSLTGFGSAAYGGGISSSAYNSGGYGTRSIRSARGARKPMFITIGKDLKTKIPLMKLMPAIKGLGSKVEYFVSAGNATLFDLSQKGRLGYLHITQPLQPGSYALKISCKIKKNTKIDEETKLWYSKKKFNLKLIVKVV